MADGAGDKKHRMYRPQPEQQKEAGTAQFSFPALFFLYCCAFAVLQVQLFQIRLFCSPYCCFGFRPLRKLPASSPALRFLYYGQSAYPVVLHIHPHHNRPLCLTHTVLCGKMCGSAPCIRLLCIDFFLPLRIFRVFSACPSVHNGCAALHTCCRLSRWNHNGFPGCFFFPFFNFSRLLSCLTAVVSAIIFFHLPSGRFFPRIVPPPTTKSPS